jgi:hypothetical protein
VIRFAELYHQVRFDLGHTRPRNVTQPRQLGIVPHCTRPHQLIESVGQRQQTGDPGRTARSGWGLTFSLPWQPSWLDTAFH